MKKSRGQTLIEFVAVAIIVVGLIVFGLYKFGDKLADFFAGNEPGKKFNAGRTVKFENPKDLVSNVTVTYDGINIEPPVEKVIKAGLSGGSYIQTSGSAGRVAEMSKIMSEYVDQIKNLTGGAAGAFETELDNYKKLFTDGGSGYLDVYSGYNDADILHKKVLLIKMAIDLNKSATISNLGTEASTYLGSAALAGTTKKAVIQTFVNDVLGFGEQLDYYMDPTLYREYLGKDKVLDNVAQDKELINAISSKLGGELVSGTPEYNHVAGLMKVYYGGGYSQASPAAYNSERLCHNFGGTMVSDTECELPAP